MSLRSTFKVGVVTPATWHPSFGQSGSKIPQPSSPASRVGDLDDLVTKCRAGEKTRAEADGLAREAEQATEKAAAEGEREVDRLEEQLASRLGDRDLQEYVKQCASGDDMNISALEEKRELIRSARELRSSQARGPGTASLQGRRDTRDQAGRPRFAGKGTQRQAEGNQLSLEVSSGARGVRAQHAEWRDREPGGGARSTADRGRRRDRAVPSGRTASRGRIR